MGPEALEEAAEGWGAGAEDCDVELDGRPDAEERGVPCLVWVDGCGEGWVSEVLTWLCLMFDK